MSNNFMGNTPFSPTPRSSSFISGLIGAGILAGIEIVWYALGYFWLDNLLFGTLLYQIQYFFIDTLLVVCAPVLAALPVFFWVSKRAATQNGLAEAGIRAAFQAGGWWVIIKVLLLCLDSVLFQAVDLAALIAYVLAILLMFGSAWLMGGIGGRSGSSQGTMQMGQYPLPPSPVSGSSSGIYPPSTPHVYELQPSPQSALEIVQLRFARGEIDAQMYQEMRSQLEASARPNPNPHQ